MCLSKKYMTGGIDHIEYRRYCSLHRVTQQGLARASGPDRSLTTCAIHDYPAIRWEVSPGYHLWGERKSGEQNALPLLVTGDRQARKPANDGVPHTAVEVLTELANDLVSGAANRIPRGPLHIPPGGSRKVAAARTCGTTLPAYTRQHSPPRPSATSGRHEC